MRSRQAGATGHKVTLVKRWFAKNLGDPMLATESLSRIETLFASQYTTTGADRSGMAVFVRHESEGRLHCEVIVFFSPASVAVARSVDAEPCERPSPDGLGLLLGAEDVWHTLFPERRG